MNDKSADDPKSEEDRYFITTLARGLDVLACFRSDDTSLSNQQIAQRCHLPKSTVTRIVYTLTKRGYLVQIKPDGRYALATATLALGSAMLAGLAVRAFARPLMQELADFSQGTLALGLRHRLSIICTEVAHSSATLAPTLQVGSHIPIATSAIGRAYLAGTSDKERSAILKLAPGLDASEDDGVRAGIQRGRQNFREYGCATSFGEWQPDINEIAVTFRSRGTIAMHGLNCGGPSSGLSKEFLLAEVRPRLLVLARQLEFSALS